MTNQSINPLTPPQDLRGLYVDFNSYREARASRRSSLVSIALVIAIRAAMVSSCG